MRTIRTMLVPLALAGTLLAPAISPAHAVAPPAAVMVDLTVAFAPSSPGNIATLDAPGTLTIVNATPGAQTYTVGSLTPRPNVTGLTQFTISSPGVYTVTSSSGARGTLVAE